MPMRMSRFGNVIGLGTFFFAAAAWGFNPPEDSAGPLTLRIEGPAKVTERSMPVAVVVSNKGLETVEVHVRLGVIDAWRVDPADPALIVLKGGEEHRLDCVLHAGEETYNVHYPFHAWADLSVGGQMATAHAVLVFETLLPDPPMPSRQVRWEPIPVHPDSELPLWRLPVHRAVLSVFQEAQPVVLPVGWEGSDGRTRTFVAFDQSVDRGGVRGAIAVHPPWYAGLAGAAIVEFPLTLPTDQTAHLQFGQAIRTHDAANGEPPSDGVTFRVRVAPADAPAGGLGDVVFERHSAAMTWQDADVDLAAFAGRSIRLQLETDPGPRQDTTCDQAYWGAPRLVVGTLPAPRAFPPATTQDSRVLGEIFGLDRSYHVRIWPGTRGVLDAVIGFENESGTLCFNGFRVKVAGDSLSDNASVSRLVAVNDESTHDGSYQVRHCFESMAGCFDLVGELRTEGAALRASFHLENVPSPAPWSAVYLADVALGEWNRQADRIYAGVGNVLERPEAFSLGFDGHQLASSYVAYDFKSGIALVQGVDVPPMRLEVEPAQRRYSLHAAHAQTITLIPGRNVWENVLAWRALDQRPAAGGVANAAGRFVFDLWGGRYADSAAALERAFAYGLTDAMVIWHNWQRWGYDYRLPDILPPNPELGSEEDFRELVRVCAEHGVLFGPHDNYIDFYPDAENYSYKYIAFTPGRQPIRAWLNTGRGAQAYRWRADTVRPFLERNVEQIRRDYAPTAYFIDVWSSIGPYDYWTDDGVFYDCVYTRNSWGEAFAWIRDTLGGFAPQISESGHDQLVGWLDGAQANHLRVDPDAQGTYAWSTWPIRCRDAERIPWLDAAYHDRFVLHGAGYDPRYRAGLDPQLHGIYSDDYVATEVLTGHPAMVPEPFARDVIRKYWLLHSLARDLAQQSIVRVEFAEDDIHRQHVVWSNGTEVWVNRGVEDWTVGGYVLPEYGFWARAQKDPSGFIGAAVERRDGLIVEWSRKDTAWYVNARMPASESSPIQVTVDQVQRVNDRTLELIFRWEAAAPLAEEYRVFVHAVDDADAICFQGDHDLSPATTQWRGTLTTSARLTPPPSVRAGQRFRVYAGLYAPKTHRRAMLEGADDASRVLLGTIELLGDANEVTGVRWVADEEDEYKRRARSYRDRMNPEARLIDFGGISTAGGCRFEIGSDAVRVTPLPESPSFDVILDWAALPWDLARFKRIEALDEAGRVTRQGTLMINGNISRLTCVSGEFAYRLVE